MRFCPYCDAQNTDSALHCGQCGKALPPVEKDVKKEA